MSVRLDLGDDNDSTLKKESISEKDEETIQGTFYV